MARPSDYTEELGLHICDLIANSSKGLKTLCKENKDLPDSPSTIRRWIAANEAFQVRYTRAKEDQADVLADEIIDISDEVAQSKVLSHELIAAAKLRVDSRKFLASKLKPKKYGDKLDHTTAGQKLPASVLFLSTENMSEEQIQTYLNRDSRPDNESI